MKRFRTKHLLLEYPQFIPFENLHTQLKNKFKSHSNWQYLINTGRLHNKTIYTFVVLIFPTRTDIYSTQLSLSIDGHTVEGDYLSVERDLALRYVLKSVKDFSNISTNISEEDLKPYARLLAYEPSSTARSDYPTTPGVDTTDHPVITDVGTCDSSGTPRTVIADRSGISKRGRSDCGLSDVSSDSKNRKQLDRISKHITEFEQEYRKEFPNLALLQKKVTALNNYYYKKPTTLYGTYRSKIKECSSKLRELKKTS